MVCALVYEVDVGIVAVEIAALELIGLGIVELGGWGVNTTGDEVFSNVTCKLCVPSALVIILATPPLGP